MKKIIKNTLVNRLFRTKEVNTNLSDMKAQRLIRSKIDQYLYDVGNCNSLIEMMHIHKKMWNDGFKNRNTRPDMYGFFRTNDIATMKTSEVYLGDIWGIHTDNIPFWEENRDVTMVGNGFGIADEVLCYDLILSQYRACLVNAIKWQAKEADKLISNYIELGY